MRSIIAGLVGGVSGGAMVLAAGTVGAGVDLEQAELPRAVTQEGGDEPIAPTIMPPQHNDVNLDHHDPAAVMEIDLVGLPAADALASASSLASTPEPALTEAPVPEPEPGTMATPRASLADPAPEEAVATAHPVPDAITGDTVATPAEPISSADAAATELAAPAPAQPAPTPPAHVFRLHVPKDLPKVDLGFSPTIEPIAISGTAPRRGPVQTREPSSATSIARAAQQSTRVAMRAPVIRPQETGQSASSPGAAAAPAARVQDPNGSAQESLQRASDAVKRLSRRMGGRFGR